MEHIGHLSKNVSSLLAPIIDSDVSGCHLLRCHLVYCDTNHSRAGYEVDIVITSDHSVEDSEIFFTDLCALDLNPRRSMHHD